MSFSCAPGESMESDVMLTVSSAAEPHKNDNQMVSYQGPFLAKSFVLLRLWNEGGRERGRGGGVL